MKKQLNRTIFGASSALLMLLSTLPAQADITPTDAWTKMSEFAQLYKYSVAVGAQQQSGDTLTLTDVTFGLVQDDMAITETIDQINLKQAPDGSVIMTVSPTVNAELQLISAFEGTTTIPIAATLDGFEGQLDIVDDKFTLAYAANGMTAAIKEFQRDGQSVPVSVNITMTGLDLGYEIDKDFDGEVSSTMALNSFGADGMFSDSNSGTFTGNAQLTTLASKGFGTIPKGADVQDPMIFITGGAALAGRMSHQGGSFDFDFEGPKGTMQGNSSSDQGMVEFGISEAGLVIEGFGENLQSSFSGSTIPLPVVSFATENANYMLAIPIAKSTEPDHFVISTNLNGLTVNDGIWGMIDPSKILPRDPANLVIDLSGEMALLADLFDEEAMISSDEPAQIHALNINELRLNVAGADLTGAGAFTFDNDQPSPFGAGPKPTGELNLALTGGNGLIDKLVQLGLLPQDQAMAGRMMLGLFASPGEGPDSLTSKIEITAEGGILANGQRLQ